MSEALPRLRGYDDWRRCIEVDCGIALTPAFVEARLLAMHDDRDPHTRRFVETWGEAHRRRVIAWLEQARDELSPRGRSGVSGSAPPESR